MRDETQPDHEVEVIGAGFSGISAAIPAVALYVEGLREDGESLDSGVIRRSIPLLA